MLFWETLLGNRTGPGRGRRVEARGGLHILPTDADSLPLGKKSQEARPPPGPDGVDTTPRTPCRPTALLSCSSVWRRQQPSITLWQGNSETSHTNTAHCPGFHVFVIKELSSWLTRASGWFLQTEGALTLCSRPVPKRSLSISRTAGLRSGTQTPQGRQGWGHTPSSPARWAPH